MEEIRNDLNLSGECVIKRIGHLEHSAMFLKLIENHVDPQNVQSYEVPVFVCNDFKIDDWDLTTQKVYSNLKKYIQI
jgi:hypothetical protein